MIRHSVYNRQLNPAWIMSAQAGIALIMNSGQLAVFAIWGVTL
jgi:hypothetical protein